MSLSVKNYFLIFKFCRRFSVNNSFLRLITANALLNLHVYSLRCWSKIVPLGCLKETPRWRITVASSLHEISTDQLGNWGYYSAHPHTSPIDSTAGCRQIFKDDVNGFSSSSENLLHGTQPRSNLGSTWRFASTTLLRLTQTQLSHTPNASSYTSSFKRLFSHSCETVPF